MPKNYYVILGIGREAKPEDVRHAFRREAKRCHPDVASDESTASRFQDVCDAYETLSDSEKRKAYDAAMTPRPRSTTGPRYALRRSREPIVEPVRTRLDEFLGGVLPGLTTPDTREKDVALEIVLTPAEARTGGLFPIVFPVHVPCPHCSGAGLTPGWACPVCSGEGSVPEDREFKLGIPPGISGNTRVTLSLEDIGLRDTRLHLFIRLNYP